MIQISTRLQQYYFEKYLLEVSIATLERGGVTTSVDTYEFLAAIDAWGFPKYPEKTIILPPGTHIVESLRQFILRNTQELHEPGSWLGTWIDPLNHCCYLDITALAPCLETAKAEASKYGQRGSRKIVALYNFKQQQTVYLDDVLSSLAAQR
jgi:hypothetical protein